MKLRNVLMGAAASSLCASAALAERGSDGQVNILYWQAVSIMTPYLSNGTKDIQAREPRDRAARPLRRDGQDRALPRRRGPDGRERRRLAGPAHHHLEAQAGLLNGPTARRFTADDVVFTWQYCTDPDDGLRDQTRTSSDVDQASRRSTRRRSRSPWKGAKPNPTGRFVGGNCPDPEEAVRRLHRREGQDLHRANTEPIGTGPVHGHRLQGQRRGDPRDQSDFRDPASPPSRRR